jgi:sugar lactone lactonase YvrE
LPGFQTILSIRIDRQQRLWVLDYASYGRGQPRILAFDLRTNRLVHRYDFPSSVAGLLSMLNDFQVDPAGQKIYIAETSPILQRPALIVYDVASKSARRVLDGHPSVKAQDYLIQAPGRDMMAYGLYTLRIPVDSIALDRQGEWLYYGPVSGDRLYRVARRDLDDAKLSAEALAARVQDYGPKTLSDGITTDVDGDVYLSDMEHSAVVVLGPDRKLTTLLKDPRLRWPDGFSFAPGGWLYVTCSSLQHVLFVSHSSVREHAPYQIFRFQPGHQGVPGH